MNQQYAEANGNEGRRGSFCGRTRRQFLWEAGGGFASVALSSMLGNDGFLGRQAVAADGATPFLNPMAPKPPHFQAKAKNVIFLFMYGGPSQVDTFDEKPELARLDGKTITVKGLLYRFMVLYPGMAHAAQGGYAAYQRSPLTMAILGLLIGYYIAYYAGLLLHHRRALLIIQTKQLS